MDPHRYNIQKLAIGLAFVNYKIGGSKLGLPWKIFPFVAIFTLPFCLLNFYVTYYRDNSG